MMSFMILQGTFQKALWSGTEVAVKKLNEGVLVDEDKVCCP